MLVQGGRLVARVSAVSTLVGREGETSRGACGRLGQYTHQKRTRAIRPTLPAGSQARQYVS